jgi:hypothetical protein
VARRPADPQAPIVSRWLTPGEWPYPFNSPWVGTLVRRYGLAFWFLLTSIAHWTAIAGPWVPGFDTELAVGAAKNWLSGADPWSFSLIGEVGNTYHFAGLPPTVLIYAPLVSLGIQLAGYVGIVVSIVAAILILRRLRLPMWWLLFPPLNEAALVANPHMVLFALLILGGGWLAPAVKVYAFVPMVGEQRWRQIALALAAFLITLAVVPGLWFQWASDLGSTTGRLLVEAQVGWGLTGGLLILGIVPLLAIAWYKGLRTAGWLAVPTMWPASEFFYSSFALPVITPILAVFLAIPEHLGPPLGIAVYALQLAWNRRSAPRLSWRDWRRLEGRGASGSGEDAVDAGVGAQR